MRVNNINPLASLDGETYPKKIFNMEIVPSIIVSRGNVMVRGKENYALMKLNGKKVRAKHLIRKLIKHYDTLHLVDLDYITRGKLQVSFLKEVSENINIWYEGGIGDSEEIFDPIMSGVEKIILGTKSISSLVPVQESFEITPNVIFELDYNDGVISISDELVAMSARGILSRITAMGINKVIITYFRERKKRDRLDLYPFKNATREGEMVYASGNLLKKDMKELAEIGIHGVILKIEKILGV